ncbi:unnamed protein product [Victoria cruziana]
MTSLDYLGPGLIEFPHKYADGFIAVSLLASLSEE